MLQGCLLRGDRQSKRRVKARSISMFCLMWAGGFGVEFALGGLAAGGFEGPGGVEAEVDADVAVLGVAGLVELGAEAEDADGGWALLPEGGGGVRFAGEGDGLVGAAGGDVVEAVFEVCVGVMFGVEVGTGGGFVVRHGGA